MKLDKFLLLIIFLAVSTIGQAQTIPDFMLENLDGEWVSYSELKGDEVTVVDFWASWCKPCMKAMPEIEKLFNNYHHKGLSVISINTDGPRSISKVVPLSKTLKLSYPIISDINNELMNELNITALPTLLLVDNKGTVRYRHEGWNIGDEKEIEHQIKLFIQ
ncbi:TlpA disulfide reductase family protein [Carboxylicivirga marina]|uniref:TlpA family protein disulfide reductase n=1 Tax=Carboxylicivirga marina TaxID=2800988 RepID=A0ABS1HPA8_9BACT|nr:TlpA disulfide reductase family protein [Carboxylicivirga marina]MBK3519073.1 TlpA family protein disulfide reductase [Carboxylicivirga marina]